MRITLCLFIHGKVFCVTSLNGGIFVNVVNKFLFHQQLLWDLESSINDRTHIPAECFSQSIVIIIIIITLFESQIILAEHECCTNWGDCKSNKSNQIKCWFLRRGENRSSRRKTSQSRVENQQSQPTYVAGSGNRTRDTLVEGERSHHYTNPAP